ncbi:hypothetical protein Rcae01_03850 [Novipirellula caenicola]|uniref:Uncharacterized protein n=1 Tax=Novipirellula caenicola TaxID=1536901 RepID=A0ABP9VTB0_9BACT
MDEFDQPHSPVVDEATSPFPGSGRGNESQSSRERFLLTGIDSTESWMKSDDEQIWPRTFAGILT